MTFDGSSLGILLGRRALENDTVYLMANPHGDVSLIAGNVSLLYATYKSINIVYTNKAVNAMPWYTTV